jgi:hypothetical protein
MAAIVGDRVLDIGLAALDTECDSICVCHSTAVPALTKYVRC